LRSSKLTQYDSSQKAQRKIWSLQFYSSSSPSSVSHTLSYPTSWKFKTTCWSKFSVPPVGVALVAGCGADLCINICLTILGYFPGHIHAFYVEYIYYKRRDEARMGVYNPRPAPGVYSARVQQGGRTLAVPPSGYGTMNAPPPQQY